MTGRDWREMTRADFDVTVAPSACTFGGGGRVPAVPDAYGTAALFGDETVPPLPRGRRVRKAEPPQPEALFTLDG